MTFSNERPLTKRPSFFKSQRFKLFVSFWIFGFLLAVMFIVSVYGSQLNVRRKIIKMELDFFVEEYEKNNTLKFVRSPLTKAFSDISELPEALQKKLQGRESGIYEINTSEKIGFSTNFLVAIRNLPVKDTSIYVIYDKNDVRTRAHMNFEKQYFNMLLSGVVVIAIFGIGVGFITSYVLLRPLIKLADRIRQSNPENLPINLSQDFADDEIGLLAQTLENAMKRIKDFIEREKQFTRDASHELRTPVTIIKGALELLELSPEYQQKTICRPIGRIKRSVQDMETTIETFLWLAREENQFDEKKLCHIENVAAVAIEENRYLLKGKSVLINISVKDKSKVEVSGPVLKIAITNLVRNAFHYTMEGEINFTIRKKSIEISDTGLGIDKDVLKEVTQPHVRGKESKGFGLGLSIVKRLCDRFEWQLNIESELGLGTKVKLTI